MRGWLPFERRWLRLVLMSVLPRVGAAGEIAFADVDLESFWARFGEFAPGLLKLGLRTGVWFVIWMPLLVGDWRWFPALTAERRDKRLRAFYSSRVWLVRQLMESLKIVACFALFSQPAVRQSHGVEDDPVETSSGSEHRLAS